MAIKNINYRNFLDNGEIVLIDEERLTNVLDNIDKNKAVSRALLITLYYTGARPNEVLRMTAKDIFKEDNHVVFKVPGSKGGLPRMIRVLTKHHLAVEALEFSKGFFPDMILFFKFRNKYIRVRNNKNGKKEIIDTTDKLRYYFKKWFEGFIPGGITPYYLRHNRFTKLSASGATLEEMRNLKGSRTFESIYPYLHFSKDLSKKAARKID